MNAAARSHSAQKSWFLAVAILFLAIAWTWGRGKMLGDSFFWDARVYTRAIHAWNTGADPYALRPLPFVYPPLVLRAAALLSRAFPGHTGWYLYLVAVVISVLSLPWLLIPTYLRTRWMTPTLAMLLLTFQPRFIEEQTLNTGNISLVLYAAALATGIAGLRHNRWGWFLIVIALSAAIKPTMLALLLLPLLAGTRQLLRCAAVTAFVALLYGGQRLWMSALYARFEQALYTRLMVEHDNGFGIYSLLYQAGQKLHPLRDARVEAGIHIALTGSLLLGLILVRRYRHAPRVERLWIPAVLTLAILGNPRMSYYDEIIAIVPAIFVWVEAARLWLDHPRVPAVMAIALTVIIFVFTTNYFAGECILFAGAIILPILAAWHARSLPSTDTTAPAGSAPTFGEQVQA